MPFDPKLIHPDEPPLTADGELALPDNLAALAEQLSDDAAHLAGCYPPEGAGRVAGVGLAVVAQSEKRGWSASVVLVACVALASVAIVGFALSLGGLPDQFAAPAGNAIVQNPTPELEPAPVAASAATPEKVRAVPSTATLSLGELSGPELEAVLDLFHSGDSQSNASISF